MSGKIGISWVAAVLTMAANPVPAAGRRSETTPIVAAVPELAHLQKWDDMQGDTADPFWADDDCLYHFTCDGRGFGKQPRNLCFNKLTGPDLLHLRGELVNSMDEYGKANDTGPDGATWKACGQECIDGVFYAFVARNVYGDKSKDPLMRQTSFNVSLIKSHDHGRTWARPAQANYDAPMWPGTRFGGPSFIHYGRNGGQVACDRADQFVYVVSNNGFWNGGDDFILARVRRADLPQLDVSHWTYFRGGDGLQDDSWSGDLAQARPILTLPGKIGWTAPVFLPALNRYLLTAWYVTPTLKKWFEPNEVIYEFYEAEHPWGPWSFVSSFSDRFLSQGHMYGPNLCAKYQERSGDEVKISLFTSGCPFEDVPTGLYKMWRMPLILKTGPQPHTTLVNDDHPSVRYFGDWQANGQRGYHDYADDVHFSKAPGAAVEFTFTGTGVAWLAERYRDEGHADVFVDGQPRGSVDLKVEDFPRLAQIPVFSVQGLPDGLHTLRLVNASADYIIIDAFCVTVGAAIPSEPLELAFAQATTSQARLRPLAKSGERFTVEFDASQDQYPNVVLPLPGPRVISPIGPLLRSK